MNEPKSKAKVEITNNRCPVCGSEFDLETINTSAFNCDTCKVKDLELDLLVSDNDDYAFCQ